MSCVLKGLSCFGAPRGANAPPQLPGGDAIVVVGEVDTVWSKLRETPLWGFTDPCMSTGGVMLSYGTDKP